MTTTGWRAMLAVVTLAWSTAVSVQGRQPVDPLSTAGATGNSGADTIDRSSGADDHTAAAVSDGDHENVGAMNVPRPVGCFGASAPKCCRGDSSDDRC